MELVVIFTWLMAKSRPSSIEFLGGPHNQTAHSRAIHGRFGASVVEMERPGRCAPLMAVTVVWLRKKYMTTRLTVFLLLLVPFTVRAECICANESPASEQVKFIATVSDLKPLTTWRRHQTQKANGIHRVFRTTGKGLLILEKIE